MKSPTVFAVETADNPSPYFSWDLVAKKHVDTNQRAFLDTGGEPIGRTEQKAGMSTIMEQQPVQTATPPPQDVPSPTTFTNESENETSPDLARHLVADNLVGTKQQTKLKTSEKHPKATKQAASQPLWSGYASWAVARAKSRGINIKSLLPEAEDKGEQSDAAGQVKQEEKEDEEPGDQAGQAGQAEQAGQAGQAEQADEGRDDQAERENKEERGDEEEHGDHEGYGDEAEGGDEEEQDEQDNPEEVEDSEEEDDSEEDEDSDGSHSSELTEEDYIPGNSSDDSEEEFYNTGRGSAKRKGKRAAESSPPKRQKTHHQQVAQSDPGSSGPSSSSQDSDLTQFPEFQRVWNDLQNSFKTRDGNVGPGFDDSEADRNDIQATCDRLLDTHFDLLFSSPKAITKAFMSNLLELAVEEGQIRHGRRLATRLLEILDS